MYLLFAILWSLAPLGEAKVGIPYGLHHGLNIYLVLISCFLANVLVYPLMMFFLDVVNRFLFKYRFYKKPAIWVARRAKKGAGKNVQKYGFWGLLIFVMLPVPGTGVYAGTIAAYLFRFDRTKAFWANTIGILLSCIIVWVIAIASMPNVDFKHH